MLLLTKVSTSAYPQSNLWVTLNNEVSRYRIAVVADLRSAVHMPKPKANGEEISNPRQVIQGQGQYNSEEDHTQQIGHEGYPLDFPFDGGNLPDPLDRYPPPEHVMIYWKAFLDGIHPLTKMIHAPSIQALIEFSCQHHRSLSRSDTALLFSIQLTALMSISDEECQFKIGRPRVEVFQQMMVLTQWALIRAKVLCTFDFTLLTAFIFFLVRPTYQSHEISDRTPASCSGHCGCPYPLGSLWYGHEDFPTYWPSS
jgi:hypothetical protein